MICSCLHSMRHQPRSTARAAAIGLAHVKGMRQTHRRVHTSTAKVADEVNQLSEGNCTQLVQAHANLKSTSNATHVRLVKCAGKESFGAPSFVVCKEHRSTPSLCLQKHHRSHSPLRHESAGSHHLLRWYQYHRPSLTLVKLLQRNPIWGKTKPIPPLVTRAPTYQRLS